MQGATFNLRPKQLSSAAVASDTLKLSERPKEDHSFVKRQMSVGVTRGRELRTELELELELGLELELELELEL